MQWPQQHVIYGLGVCDRLDDNIGLLLKWAHDKLVPGGWLMLTSLSHEGENTYRAFVEYILDWPVSHRTCDHFKDLISRAAFDWATSDIRVDDSKVNIIVRCRKS